MSCTDVNGPLPQVSQAEAIRICLGQSYIVRAPYTVVAKPTEGGHIELAVIYPGKATGTTDAMGWHEYAPDVARFAQRVSRYQSARALTVESGRAWGLLLAQHAYRESRAAKAGMAYGNR